MKRKIMKLGPSTLVMSLPSKWAKELSIHPGDEMDVEEQNNRLIIKTDKGFNAGREVLDLTTTHALLKRMVASRYLKGADEIEVIVNSLEKSRIIQKRVDEFIGMEIIEQNKNRLIIKDIGGSTEDNFDNILKRVLYLLNSLSEESFNAIAKKETDLEYLEDLEKNMNKFTDYCFRMLNKKGYSDYKKTAVLYCILFLIEEIADEYKHMNAYINKNALTLKQDIIGIYESTHTLGKDMQRLFLKFQGNDAAVLAEKRDSIIAKIESRLANQKTTNKEIIILKHLEAITDHIVKVMGQLLNIN